MHVVAFVEDQSSVTFVSHGMVTGPFEPFAVMFAVGGAEATWTVTDALAEPPGPVQVAVYVASVVRFPVLCKPEMPDQFGGAMVHDVAFVLDQEMFAEVLYAILHRPEEPLQRMLAVGAAGVFTTTVACPCAGGAISRSTMTFAVYVPAEE